MPQQIIEIKQANPPQLNAAWSWWQSVKDFLGFIHENNPLLYDYFDDDFQQEQPDNEAPDEQPSDAFTVSSESNHSYFSYARMLNPVANTPLSISPLSLARRTFRIVESIAGTALAPFVILAALPVVGAQGLVQFFTDHSGETMYQFAYDDYWAIANLSQSLRNGIFDTIPVISQRGSQFTYQQLSNITSSIFHLVPAIFSRRVGDVANSVVENGVENLMQEALNSINTAETMAVGTIAGLGGGVLLILAGFAIYCCSCSSCSSAQNGEQDPLVGDLEDNEMRRMDADEEFPDEERQGYQRGAKGGDEIVDFGNI